MSVSIPEVVVDHVSDLSSAKEPILFLSFLFLQTDLSLEVRILEDLLQRRRNPRIQHLKSGETGITSNWARWFFNRPQSAISTSLNHNIASKRELEHALTWVLNLIFQYVKTLKVWEIYQNFAPISEVFVDQPCLLLLERENFWWKVSLRISVLKKCLYFVLHFQLQVSPCLVSPGHHL